jgi:predicted dehydrogenase
MVNVGVIGLGLMGQTHLDAYSRVEGARVVAVADKDEALLTGQKKVKGTFEGQAKGGYDLTDAARYTDGMELIRDPNVDMVDLCLVTPLHVPFAVAALKAGKHVLIEKPLARKSEDAIKILDAQAGSSGLAMCAHCMRFWPGWDWLKQAVDDGRYGKVCSASFTRLGEQPESPFYRDGKHSGGAILDLHIHDTDFIHHLFGVPREVTSFGYSQVSGCVDHVTTIYHYDHVPYVVAEGAWVPFKGFEFTTRYNVVFERAAATFDMARDNPLTLIEQGKEPQTVELAPGMGYEYEIAYFIDCIKAGRDPVRSSIREAAKSLCILEAEVQSVASGRAETVRNMD